MPASEASPVARRASGAPAIARLRRGRCLDDPPARRPAAMPPSPASRSLARIVSLQGRVEVQPAGAAGWPRRRWTTGSASATPIRVGAYVAARRWRCANNSVLRLDQLHHAAPRSAQAESGRSLLELLFGAVHFFSHRPRALEIDTPIANAGTEGTEFLMRVAAGAHRGGDARGPGAAARRPRASCVVASGEAGVARAGAAPPREIVARPRDAVAWALYYPPILAPLAERGAAPARCRRACSARSSGSRRTTMPARSPRSTRCRRRRAMRATYTYRAGVLLNVGRVDEAEEAIARGAGAGPRGRRGARPAGGDRGWCRTGARRRWPTPGGRSS